MSLITDTWRQLVRRRLWPVAVLLLGALVAVPVLLAKSPAAVPPAPAPARETAAPAGGGLEAEPVVAVADASTSRRHVLGRRKDPFEPALLPKPTPTATPSAPGTTTTTTGQNGGSFTIGSPTDTTTPPVSIGNGGGSFPGVSGGGVSPTTPVTPATPSAPKRKLAPGTLTVRWGDASADTLDKLTVKRLDALPDLDAPVAIYLGPGKAKDSAVFLVDATVTPEGDASCRPSASDCQKVELRKGDTEFFTVADPSADTTGTDTTTTTDTTPSGTQFELRLVDVAGGGKAKASRAHGARAAHAHASHARVTVARVVRLLHP
jgi:hypothetical protein